jgi:hypothetical protein
VYAGIVIIGIVGLLTDQILSFIGRHLFPWESGNRRLFRLFSGFSKQKKDAEVEVPGAARRSITV